MWVPRIVSAGTGHCVCQYWSDRYEHGEGRYLSRQFSSYALRVVLYEAMVVEEARDLVAA